jgi:lactate racemase
MICTLGYGRQGLPVTLPDDWEVTILSKKRMPALGDPADGIRAALASPLGSASLREEAAGCATACILICDITRPVPNGLVLRPLVEEMLAAGMKASGITLLVATGLHRPGTEKELEQIIGDAWVQAHARVENHLARSDADHALAGTTRQGVPVRLDRRFLEADLRIAVGLVEPHFMAGWSGGRKLVLPGIAHADTIRAFHAAHMLADPGAVTCGLQGNPLHLAQLETLGMIGRALSVNMVIDENRRLSFASFGGIEESHAAAVRFAAPWFQVEVPERFPVVLASAAGYPLDSTYYQAVKGICAGAAITAPGGDLFVAAECGEGLGSMDFRASQESLCAIGRERFRGEAVSRPRAEIDEWETFMLVKALDGGARVHLLADGLSDSDHALSGVLRCRDLPGELRAAVLRDARRRLAVLPEGPYVAAEVRPEQARPR